METSDPCHESCTFIIRIWCEPRETDRIPNLWRGTIEEVSGDRRQAIHSLDDIEDFIIPYLEQFGVRISIRWRARRWLRRRWVAIVTEADSA